MNSEELTQAIFKQLCDNDTKYKDRATYLFHMWDEGHRKEAQEALAKYIQTCGATAELAEFLEAMKNGALSSEFVIDVVEKFGMNYAVVTNGRSTVHVPIQPEYKKGGKDELKQGDAVLVSNKAGCLVGRDALDITSGNMATVENVMNDGRSALVNAYDGPKVYYVSEAVRKQIKPGSRVIVDEQRSFISLVMPEIEDHGESVLTPMEVLDSLDISRYSEISHAADEILFRAKAFVDHPEWLERFEVRNACSFLFCGPTGTGKSTALKIIAKKLSDHVETLTGERQSRLVMADSTTFYTSFFGETEQRIKHWFEQLRKLGHKKLHDKSGKEIKVPILVVIEEGEALFRARGAEDASAHLFDRPLSLILQMSSSVAGEISTPIITVVTSNRPSLMDAAALRRFGMRRVNFRSLDRNQTKTLLNRQFGEKVPFLGDKRDEHLETIEEYLFGDVPEQPVAFAKVAGSSGKRPINRSELVTPAIIEEACSSARDTCLRESVQADKLIGISGEAIVKKLDDHFTNMARGLTKHNLEEYLPHWFSDEPTHVTDVVAAR